MAGIFPCVGEADGNLCEARFRTRPARARCERIAGVRISLRGKRGVVSAGCERGAGAGCRHIEPRAAIHGKLEHPTVAPALEVVGVPEAEIEIRRRARTVSYTHLTLPTSDLV